MPYYLDMANAIATARTSDGVIITAEDNGAIGDAAYEITFIRLKPEAQAIVMSHVPHVTHAEIAGLIRLAKRNKLAPWISEADRRDRFECAMVHHKQRIAEAVQREMNRDGKVRPHRVYF